MYILITLLGEYSLAVMLGSAWTSSSLDDWSTAMAGDWEAGLANDDLCRRATALSEPPRTWSCDSPPMYDSGNIIKGIKRS